MPGCGAQGTVGVGGARLSLRLTKQPGAAELLDVDVAIRKKRDLLTLTWDRYLTMTASAR
jgi:hypothetical protein